MTVDSSLSACLLTAALAFFLGVLLMPGHARAANGSCSPSGGSPPWLCSWSNNPMQPGGATLFFNAPGGNNLRNWQAVYVGDYHSGNVHDKCASVIRGSDGAHYGEVCGNYLAGQYIPLSYRPAYAWIRLKATVAGPRNLYGLAEH